MLSIVNVISVLTALRLNMERKEVVYIEIEPIPITQDSTISIEDETIKEDINKLTDSEINLIAKCVLSEAENQPKLGKQYVIDTILNRVDSDEFPDTVEEVINQKNQYYVVKNKQVDFETLELIEYELNNRTDSDVMFFRTEKFHSFAEPVVQIGDHYFSKLKED